MLTLYHSLMGASGLLLRLILRQRLRKGKEDPARLNERMGLPGRPRPHGALVWFHAASVGEAQSTLILVKTLHREMPDASILVTTGTVTSAALMATRLPEYAFHQYYPLDHPRWVKRFLDYWQPHLVMWMESEIWPNMLREIDRRTIPAVLVNAHLSERSFKRWRKASGSIRALLKTFSLVLAQTQEDATYFHALGARQVTVTDNLKYSADRLPCDTQALQALQDSVGGRPVWLYASTHDGEEALACRLHKALQSAFPDLLTIIAPRHPDRRAAIQDICAAAGLKSRLRTRAHALPEAGDNIYIADTIGEMGLFYNFAPLTCIGRSFSADGGGGHNPIEAAQYECGILYGPHVQNLARIYEDMARAGAVIALKDEEDFAEKLRHYLSDPAALAALQQRARTFAADKAVVLETVMKSLAPLLTRARTYAPPAPSDKTG